MIFIYVPQKNNYNCYKFPFMLFFLNSFFLKNITKTHYFIMKYLVKNREKAVNRRIYGKLPVFYFILHETSSFSDH